MAGDEAEHGTETAVGKGWLATGSAGSISAGGQPSDRGEPAETDTDADPVSRESGSGMAGQSPGASTRDQAGVEPSSGTPDAQEVSGGRGGELEFSFAVDVIYHRARAAWFAGQHRLFLFGTIMAGSAAAADLANVKELALLAAGLGTLDLVLDPTTRMVEHRDLARDTLAIVADLHRNDFSDEACRRAADENFRLSANETAPFNALRTMAFNQAITAFGRAESARVWVPLERRLLSNLCRFEGWEDANRDRMAWLRQIFARLRRSTQP